MLPKILLLQARLPDDPMKAQEISCFAGKCELPEASFVSHDLLEGPPRLDLAFHHDALMMGGSGDYLVSRRNLPEFDRLLEFLREVVRAGHPTFASCFGFQCLVAACGGEIVHDLEAIEVGTYELELTEEGRLDPILGELPARFDAQMGRKDRAARLPEGFVNLASSESCPFQAFRIPERPIWATQFHPELNGGENRERFEAYLTQYESCLPPAERRRALDRFHDSPATGGMLLRFLELAVGHRAVGAAC